MKNKKTNIILPFNMEKDSYIGMFEGVENPLSMSIMPMAVEGLDPNILKEVIAKAKEITLQINSDRVEMERMCKSVPPGYRLMDIPVIDESVFTLASTNAEHDPYPTLAATESLQDWCYNGVYYQIGFHKFPCNDNNLVSGFIASSMLGYDMMVMESGSLEPEDHNPAAIEIDGDAYDNFSQYYFHGGCGRWNRSLINLRNHWLVTLRAVLMDRDPVAEWDRFEKAGGNYFLEYPTLCP